MVVKRALSNEKHQIVSDIFWIIKTKQTKIEMIEVVTFVTWMIYSTFQFYMVQSWKKEKLLLSFHHNFLTTFFSKSSYCLKNDYYLRRDRISAVHVRRGPSEGPTLSLPMLPQTQEQTTTPDKARKRKAGV